MGHHDQSRRKHPQGTGHEEWIDLGLPVNFEHLGAEWKPGEAQYEHEYANPDSIEANTSNYLIDMDPSAASFSRETPPSSPSVEHLAAATAAPFPYTPQEYDFQARPRRSGDYSVSMNMHRHSKRRKEGNHRSQDASGPTVEHDTLKSRLSRATLTAGEDKTSNAHITTAESLIHNGLDPLNTRSTLAFWEANDDAWDPISFRTNPQHSTRAKSVTRDLIKVASEELDIIDSELKLLPITTWKEWTTHRDSHTSSNVRPPNKPSGGDDSIGRLHKTEHVQKSSLQSTSLVKRPILRSDSSRRKRETEKLKFKFNPANGGHGMEEVVEEGYYNWLWTCCNCSKSEAMTVDATPACPSCGVFRCGNCPLEPVKRRNLAHAITNGRTRSRVHHSASLEDLQPTTEPHQTTLQEAHQGASRIVEKAHSWLGLKEDPNVSSSLPPKISSPVGPLNVALVASNAAPSWAPGVGTGLAAGTLVSGVLGTTIHNCYSFRIEEKRKCEEIERKRRDSDAASKAANRPLRWEYGGNPDDPLICRHGPLRHSKNRGMISPNEARRAMFQNKRRKPATSRRLSETEPFHVYESDSVSESSSDGEPSEGETSGTLSVLQSDGEISGSETSGSISALQRQRRPSPPVALKGSESTAHSCHATTQESAPGVGLAALDGDSNQLQHMSNQTSLILSPSSTSVKSSSDYTQEEHVQPSPLSYQLRPFSASLRIIIPPFPDDSQEREKWYKLCKVALWEAFKHEKDTSESVWKLLGHEMLDPYIGHVLNPVPPGTQDQVNWFNFYLLILRGVKGGFVSFEKASWEF